jgi:hypothetical protein
MKNTAFTPQQRKRIYLKLALMYEKHSHSCVTGMCYELGQLMPNGFFSTPDKTIYKTFPELFSLTPPRKERVHDHLYWYEKNESGNLLRSTALCLAAAMIDTP